MSTERQYYTPTIEEFHVGFEYEDKDIQSLNKQLNYGIKFTKRIFDNSCNLKGFEQSLSRGEVKVPYLSKEDIEECGFEYEFESSYIKEDYRVIYSEETIENLEDLEVVIQEFGECILRGNIRNKSEFKQVLRMLNIK
tara:strand:+ start:26 stop:439 length:414 start_codon:yes stop_codon:yes gene_type:complete